MTQYQAFESSKVLEATVLEKKRTLNWEGLISGETALQMAKNIESLFGGAGAAGAILPPGQSGVHPKATTKLKLFNPKACCNMWGARSSDWAKLFREFHSNLKTKEPQGPTI
eukprot:178894-Pyramimonas_sp.AAC.1